MYFIEFQASEDIFRVRTKELIFGVHVGSRKPQQLVEISCVETLVRILQNQLDLK